MIPLLLALVALSDGLREAPSSNLRPATLSIDSVLNGSTRNLTAVMVNATPISNNTIQIVFEANVTATSTTLLPVTTTTTTTTTANTTPTTTMASTTTTTPVSTTTTTPASTTTTSPEPVTNKTLFSIVYSAHDLNSTSLITNGLSPIFTRPDIISRTSLQLVPYGNATEIKVNTLSAGFLYWHPELQKGNITNVYRCPSGEAECESSLIHACAVNISQNDPAKYIPFISCMVSSPIGTSPEDSSFECSNSTQFMESLRECALGPVGITLQHQLAQQAANTKYTLPAIYVNGEYHPFNLTKKAYSPAAIKADFNKLVCDAIFADGLMDRDVCETGNSTKTITAPFESLLSPSSARSNKEPKSSK